jgi:hypothetical protein
VWRQIYPELRRLWRCFGNGYDDLAPQRRERLNEILDVIQVVSAIIPLIDD